MKLAVREILHPGDLANECLVLDVLTFCEIGAYMVARTTMYPDGSVSEHISSAIWLPDRKMKPGDQVQLWSKVGINGDRKLLTGGTAMRIFLARTTPVWTGAANRCVLLIRLADWEATPLES